MKKILFASFLIIVLAFAFSLNFTFAKNDKNTDIPEQDGVYDVPGHPELKVRVFVHKIGGKPAPTPVWGCGLPDPGSEAVVDKEVWKLPSEWTYNLNPGSAPSSVGSGNAATITDNAFRVWTDVINKKVKIFRGADTPITRKGYDGKNIITWGSASGSALGVTYIWYYPSTGLVAELDTILNTKFFWMWSGGLSTCAWSNSYDAQGILTHELGHWFGLDDEYTSEYENNTMYGYGYKRDAKADTLTTGDIDGVKAIY